MWFLRDWDRAALQRFAIQQWIMLVFPQLYLSFRSVMLNWHATKILQVPVTEPFPLSGHLGYFRHLPVGIRHTVNTTLIGEGDFQNR